MPDARLPWVTGLAASVLLCGALAGPAPAWAGAAGARAPLSSDPAPPDPSATDEPVQADGADDIDPPSPDEAIRYILNVRGLEPTGLLQRFTALSALAAGASTGAQSRFRLEGQLRQDQATLTALLHAEGWFGARQSAQLAPAPGQPGSLVVLIMVEPGARYRFGTVRLPEGAGDLARVAAEAGLAPDAPARTQAVLDAQASLWQTVREAGHAFAPPLEADVLVDHDAARVEVDLAVPLGPRARFGAVRAAAPAVLGTAHLGRIARFRPGMAFEASRVEDLRQALLATGLYASLSVTVEPDPTDPAVADVRVSGTPALRRTVALSAGYGTSEGPKVEASWQHRNLFGAEERLTLLGRAGTQDQRVSADLRRFNFGRRDRTLLGTAALAREDTDAFTSLSATLTGGIERETELLWQKRWVYALLGRAELARLREGGARSVLPARTFVLLSLPGTLRYDGTDDLFDPHGGFRLSGTLEPEVSIRSRTNAYVRVDLSASLYRAVDVGRETIMAARLRLGTIAGASLAQIAASRRFYSGGGGSVRGFGYQGVGPRDAANQPSGGRSLAEVSFEARVAVTPKIGVVPFVDGGAVDGGGLPDVTALRWGAGIGLRYDAGFAPLRVDVATPLSRRRPGDPRVSVYVSVGQSF